MFFFNLTGYFFFIGLKTHRNFLENHNEIHLYTKGLDGRDTLCGNHKFTRLGTIRSGKDFEATYIYPQQKMERGDMQANLAISKDHES